MNSLIHHARVTVLAERKGLDALFEAFNEPDMQQAFSDACALIKSSTRVITMGVGKSGHIARKIAATFASIGQPAQFINPTDARHGDLGMVTMNDCVLMLSHSGASSELMDTLDFCGAHRVPVIGMTFKRESPLGQKADVCLFFPPVDEADEEIPAPTTSTTMSLVLGDAIAIALMKTSGFTLEHFRATHPAGDRFAIK